MRRQGIGHTVRIVPTAPAAMVLAMKAMWAIKVTRAEIRVQRAVYRHQELAQLGANIEKAAQVLKWVPKRSLTQMIEDEWRFYLNTLKGN